MNLDSKLNDNYEWSQEKEMKENIEELTKMIDTYKHDDKYMIEKYGRI